MTADDRKKPRCVQCGAPLQDAPGIGPFCANTFCSRIDDQRKDARPQCEAVNGNGHRCVFGKDHIVDYHFGDDGKEGVKFYDHPCPDEYADD